MLYDARTSAYAGRGVIRSGGNHSSLDYDVWTRAVILLLCPHLVADGCPDALHPRACARARNHWRICLWARPNGRVSAVSVPAFYTAACPACADNAEPNCAIPPSSSRHSSSSVTGYYKIVIQNVLA